MSKSSGLSKSNLPRQSDVGAKLFARVKAFLKLIPRTLKNRQSEETLVETPRLANALVDFLQRQVRLPGDQGKQSIGVVLKRRTPVDRALSCLQLAQSNASAAPI